MRHILNNERFIKVLANIKNPTLTEKRNWKTRFRGNSCGYWNFILWSCIHDIEETHVGTMDESDLWHIDEKNCIVLNIKERVYKLLTSNKRSLYFDELETFLNIVEQDDYEKIMDCLSLEVKVYRNREDSLSSDLSHYFTPLNGSPNKPEPAIQASEQCPFLKWIFPSCAFRSTLLR